MEYGPAFCAYVFKAIASLQKISPSIDSNHLNKFQNLVILDEYCEVTLHRISYTMDLFEKT
jgi:hypothetical protein